MNKLQKILSGVLVIQIIIIAVVYYANRNAPSTTQSLLEGFDAEKIIKLTITDPDGTLIIFEKNADQWVLPSYGDYPVIDTSLSDILAEIGTINTSRLVASTTSSHNRLQVEKDNYIKKLTIEDSLGKQTILYLGSSPTTSNVNIRLESSNQVYLTNQVTPSQLPTSISSWISTTYLQLGSANISSLTIKNTNGEFNFSQDENNAWSTSNQLPQGYTFDETKWNTIRSSLVTIRMAEPIGKDNLPDYGFDSPAVIVTYLFTNESGNSEQQQLILGNPTPDGEGVYAKSDSAAYIVKINNYTASQITNFGYDSFSSPPVEETPES